MTFRVISRKRIREFGETNPDAARPLQKWFRMASHAEWQNLQDVRRVFPQADAVQVASGNSVTVFNVAGNKYRLVAAIHYNRRRLYILRILRHSEYSRGKWKDEL
jgi:mRNA interferase HigB